MINSMQKLDSLQQKSFQFNEDKIIKSVVFLVVVEEEVRPVLDRYQFKTNEELQKKLLNLAYVYSGTIKTLNVDLIQVCKSGPFNRHFSGYTQVAAICGLISSVIKPDLVINFGTCGAYLCPEVHIGDILIGKSCLYIDRLRTISQESFEWGIWGGGVINPINMINSLNLKRVNLGCQIGYMITDFHKQLIDKLQVKCLDMECASIAEILNQTKINFLAIKVVSNGVYDDMVKQEKEYHENRESVSIKAKDCIEKIIIFIEGKTIREL